MVGAAARELFEEAGVLLAGPVAEPDRTVSDVPATRRGRPTGPRCCAAN